MALDHAVGLEAHLLRGCLQEAERGDIVVMSLEGLRQALPESFHGHMVGLLDEMRSTSQLLRELADRSQVFYSRVPIVINYLNVILPCLSKSLRDITAYYDDKTLSREIRWRKMYNKMTDEAGGLPLPQRFMLYNSFLSCLTSLLIRSPNFDLNKIEALRSRIMQLREQRGIPPPPTAQAGPPVPADNLLVPASQEHANHWAELIFSVPLPSRTGLKHLRPSRSFGPHLPWGYLTPPQDCRILFRRPFDNDQLSVTVYTNGMAQAPYVLIRHVDRQNAMFALRGAHELCIHRSGSALELRRWSNSQRGPKLWALLFFQTWEEMVLFYCTFVSLKFRTPLTVEMDPEEMKLSSERRMFQAQIIDDGYRHSLVVYQDVQTKGIRLHASVWEGELRGCPVWTAFVTHQSSSPTWLVQKSKHRVWLQDVNLYVFCQRYSQQNQRQGRSGAFEIYFVSREAPRRFKEIFVPRKVAVAVEVPDAPAAG